MKKKGKCYICSRPATSKEHIPAQCFFPEDYRCNLLTVPSCEKHNNEKSSLDEYVFGVIYFTSYNKQTEKLFDKIVRAFKRDKTKFNFLNN